MPLIAVFRDPLERLFSHWVMLRSRNLAWPDWPDFLTEWPHTSLPDAVPDRRTHDAVAAHDRPGARLLRRAAAARLRALRPRASGCCWSCARCSATSSRPIDRTTDFLGLPRFEQVPPLRNWHAGAEQVPGTAPTADDLARWPRSTPRTSRSSRSCPASTPRAGRPGAILDGDLDPARAGGAVRAQGALTSRAPPHEGDGLRGGRRSWARARRTSTPGSTGATGARGVDDLAVADVEADVVDRARAARGAPEDQVAGRELGGGDAGRLGELRDRVVRQRLPARWPRRPPSGRSSPRRPGRRRPTGRGRRAVRSRTRSRPPRRVGAGGGGSGWGRGSGVGVGRRACGVGRRGRGRRGRRGVGVGVVGVGVGVGVAGCGRRVAVGRGRRRGRRRSASGLAASGWGSASACGLLLRPAACACGLLPAPAAAASACGLRPAASACAAAAAASAAACSSADWRFSARRTLMPWRSASSAISAVLDAAIDSACAPASACGRCCGVAGLLGLELGGLGPLGGLGRGAWR